MFCSACEDALPVWKKLVGNILDDLEVDVNIKQLLNDSGNCVDK